MARCRFVGNKVTRLALSEDYFVDVNDELTAGQQHNIFARMVTKMEAGEKAQLDPSAVQLAKMAEYIVGWNFTDQHGAPVPFSVDALRNMDLGTFKEISEAVEAHEDAIEKAAAERKNGQGGASAS